MTTRLSRAEQQARTHRDLLATARAEFLKNGYTATRLDVIAERAGYSKGAVYSNFTDKPALCQAVLADIRREKFDEVEVIATSSDDLATVADALGDWFRTTVGDVEWTSLELEFSALARTDSVVRAMTVASRREISGRIAQLLTDVLGAPDEVVPGVVLPQMSDVADLLLSTGIGLGISRAFDPEVSLEPGITGMKAAVGLLTAVRGATVPPQGLEP
ncbi:MAG: TetR/AcrR family transcriptional regulator [Gordonia sp. (in: high G+C Gram-positive bacteria)]|uniref:TetR/AcrR family transcriptional regulator n=1 Tax=Gordonia sp. (in: high G+C Gram-positive bacteria) TaxID=84139 RepID=UPI0039E2CE01